MDSIIVKSLAKAYKYYPSRWFRLLEWFSNAAKPRHQLAWVLKDISFTVKAGEAVGIVGVNGAGKSTLLKIITGIVQPTQGSVKINGRVAALLELGMGFHPEFTGRQNVQMAAQLLGMSLEQINSLMPEIEDFAEIGEYIDQPIRVYSSGMQMRLAFAVSTAIHPDILIVDEALAVGDIRFQRKCYARIEERQKNGMTLLFVSHDTELIKRICNKAILLNNGVLQAYGEPSAVIEEYERIIFSKDNQHLQINVSGDDLGKKAEKYYGDGSLFISDIEIQESNALETNFSFVRIGRGFFISYFYESITDIEAPIFSLMIKTKEGICAYYADSLNMGICHEKIKKGEKGKVVFSLENNLIPGDYFLNVAVRSVLNEREVVHCRKVDAAHIPVRAPLSLVYPGGIVDLKCKIEIKST